MFGKYRYISKTANQHIIRYCKKDTLNQFASLNHSKTLKLSNSIVSIPSAQPKHIISTSSTAATNSPSLPRNTNAQDIIKIDLPQNTISISVPSERAPSNQPSFTKNNAQPAMTGNSGLGPGQTYSVDASHAGQTTQHGQTQSIAIPIQKTTDSQDDDDGTRPMILGPTAVQTRSNAIKPMDASGGPGGSEIQPALLSWSGGAQGGPPLNKATDDLGNHYTAQSPVPIGFLANILSDEPVPNDPFNAANWSGGTYDGYISTPYNQAPPPTVSIPKTPTSTNTGEYIFATDGQARQYTVTFDAISDLGTDYHADLTFSTIAPSQASITNPVGQNVPSAYYEQVNNIQNLTLRLGQEAGYATNAGAGVNITATTQTNPTYGGDFAFIQTINSQRYATFNNGMGGLDYFRQINIGNGPNQDSQGNLGYAIDGTFTNAIPTTGWTLAAGQGPVSHNMIDSPSISVGAGNLVSITAGYPPKAGGGDGPVQPESFVTYLMHKGDTYSTVWVALQQVKWQWTGKATPATVFFPISR